MVFILIGIGVSVFVFTQFNYNDIISIINNEKAASPTRSLLPDQTATISVRNSLNKEAFEIGKVGMIGAAESDNIMTLPDLFSKVEQSVVQITDDTYAASSFSSRMGSGFVYDNNRHIITNNHVVDGSSRDGDFDVTFLDGTIYNAKLIGSDPYADLAVLYIPDVPKDKLVPLPIGSSTSLKVGQQVAAVGNPFGLSGSMTEGIVSGLGRSLPSSIPEEPTIPPQLDIPSMPAPPVFSIPDIIQTDAAINPGNSGGPLLNMRGEVVGINTAIFSNTGAYSGVGFAIPSNMIKKVVPSLITTGSYQHPWIGISGVDVSPEIANTIIELKEEPRGFLVTDIISQSPADKAGIRGGEDQLVNIKGREVSLGGDIILEIDDKTVRKIDDILSYLQQEKKVGDNVKLTVLRADGLIKEISLTLDARSGLDQLS